MASYVVPPVSKKIVMRASIDMLEALITAYAVEKGGNVAPYPSPLVKNKRLANR